MKNPFGANWQPKVIGLLAIAAGVISQDPSLVSFLPATVAKEVVGISGLSAAILAGAGLLTAKSANVTGGTVPATNEAKDRIARDLASQPPVEPPAPTPSFASTVKPST